MGIRQDSFIDAFPMQDVMTLKNVVFGGKINAREDFLAVENVANYAAGQLLPASGVVGSIASAQVVSLTDQEIIDVCDQAMAAHSGDALSARGDLLKQLLQAALQLLPLILPLL